MKHYLKLTVVMSVALVNACQQGGGDTDTAQKKPTTSSANSQSKDAATSNGTTTSNGVDFKNYSGSCNEGDSGSPPCRDYYYSQQDAPISAAIAAHGGPSSE